MDARQPRGLASRRDPETRPRSNAFDRHNDRMTREQVKEILDRVLSWPPERQADVVHVVEIMEEQDKSGL